MSERLLELTRKDLLSDVDSWTKKKTKLVRQAKYRGIKEDYTIIFEVPSVTASPPTTYTVAIKMLEYADIAEDDSLSVAERVRLALAGDLKISCTCPAFLYFGYKYILTQLDTNASDDENRFPKIRNPDLQGVMCKHCYKAIQVLTFNWSIIAKDIKNKNFLK